MKPYALALLTLLLASGCYASPEKESKPFMSNLVGVYDITIISKDVAASKKFYGAIGLPIVHEKGNDLVVYTFGNLDLAIHKETDELKAGGSTAISVIVKDVALVEKALKKNKIDYDGPKGIHAGFSGLEAKGPDGTRVYILQQK